MAATGTDPEVVVSRPCPGLAGQVRGYCGYREAGSVPVRRREVPGGRVAVIVSFGEAIAVDGVAQRSFVAGMHDGPAITEHAGSQHGVQVDLAPLAVTRCPELSRSRIVSRGSPPPPAQREDTAAMMVIGVDPHKSTHTATAVDPSTNRSVASIRVEASLADYARMLRWARQFEQRRWAVENAEGLGRHLSSWLLARGEQVVDVPSTATARVRQLSRGGGRKNDQIDAAAAACVAALQGDGRPLAAEGITDALALLDESWMNLAQCRVRLVNQLHALLRELLAGGAPKDLSATAAGELLRRVRPAGDVERVRKQIAAGLVTQIRSVDALLKSNAKQISELVAASGSTLTDTVGVGAITAGRLIGRTGRADRFPSSASFANYAGAAPIEVASAQRARHRLSRSGDRQLNAALHTVVAITQVRTPGSRGHAYYNAKIAQGKTTREARRCLKRRLPTTSGAP